MISRPPSAEDAEAVTELFRADEAVTSGHAHTTINDLRSDWARPSFSLAHDAITLWSGDTLIGYAEVHDKRAWAAVAPDRRGRGHGTHLLQWIQDQAKTRGWPDVGQTISDAASDAQALFQSHGWTPTWESWVFSLDLTGRTPQLPRGGLTVRALERPGEDSAAHGVIERAFSEWPNRQPVTLEDWLVSHVDRPDVEVLVADAGDGPVGVALLLDEGEGEGWVAQLAVDAARRGQGIGRTLLDAAFLSFATRGCTTAGLSTDSRTGARGLYEAVGMQVTETLRRWTLTL